MGIAIIVLLFIVSITIASATQTSYYEHKPIREKISSVFGYIAFMLRWLMLLYVIAGVVLMFFGIDIF